MRRVLFFPQNETHVSNMLPIACELLGDVEIFFLFATDYFRQDIIPSGFQFKYRNITRRSLGSSFYAVSFFEKIKLVKEFSIELGLLDLYDAVIVSNDGALQRVVLDKIKGTSNILLLDGIISDYSFSFCDILRYSRNKASDVLDYIRRSVRGSVFYASSLPLIGPYLPSEIGCYPFDKAFVMSCYVADVLSRRGSNIREYLNFGMPRYKNLYERKNNINLNYTQRSNKKHLRVLFITQGYLWHNELDNDRFQHEALKKIIDLVGFLRNELEIELIVRVHPRDNYENYKNISAQIQDCKMPLVEAFQETDVVLGFNSTVLLESSWLGVPTFSLMLDQRIWKFKRSFVGNGTLRIVESVDELKLLLLDIGSGKYFENKNEEKMKNLFNAYNYDTVKNIAKNIIS